MKDAKAEDLTRQPEQIKAFRDTWELGIHSYLTYLRDRLAAASDLLTESGSIFVQIGDENVHLMRSLMDEVFGAENFCLQITFRKTGGQSSDTIASVADYLLWYARDHERVKYRAIYQSKADPKDRPSIYRWLEIADNKVRRKMTASELDGSVDIPPGSKIFACDNLTSPRPANEADLKSFTYQGVAFTPGKGTFKSDEKGLDSLAAANRLFQVSTTLYYVRYLDDFPVVPIDSIWQDTSAGGYTDERLYVVQTTAR